MKNKLLVSVFVGAIAVFAFTSCETKSDVKDVCTDMIKSTLHKSPRSLVQFDNDHDKLTISEYEFLGGVNDNRIVYRTLTFGNGVYEPKSVDTLTYEYGEWNEHGTAFSLLLTPRAGDPYTLKYEGNAFIAPDGRAFGGADANNTARVEKWEKTLGTLLNTDWEATYRGKFTMDSIFRDSIKAIYVGPPIMFKYDTLKIFTGKMDTLAADTTCTFRYEFKHDPYFVIQVRTVETALEHRRVRHTQVLLDIFLHLRRSRSCQRNNRRHANALHHTAYLAVLRTEIMTPLRDTMRLIYCIKTDLHALKEVHVLVLLQTLRCQIQQLRPAG